MEAEQAWEESVLVQAKRGENAPESVYDEKGPFLGEDRVLQQTDVDPSLKRVSKVPSEHDQDGLQMALDAAIREESRL